MNSRGFAALAWMASFTAAVSASCYVQGLVVHADLNVHGLMVKVSARSDDEVQSVASAWSRG